MPAMSLLESSSPASTMANGEQQQQQQHYSGADGGSVSVDWLWAHLRDASWSDNGVSTATASGELITLLDCRSASDFGECHIRRAVHLSLPSIMLRRLAGGKVTIGSVLKSNNASPDVLAKRPWAPPPSSSSSSSGAQDGSSSSSSSSSATTANPKHTFVLCGGGEMVAILRKSLIQDGCPVVCLQGGVEEFRTKYPEWCVTRDSMPGAKVSSDARPHLRIGVPASSSSSPASSSSVKPLQLNGVVASSSSSNRRPGSLGSRSASDSEEERPDSSLESADHHHRHDVDFDEDNGPRAFGSGFSLGLSVGLRLGLESEPLPPLNGHHGSSTSSSTSSSASSFNGSSSSSTSSATMTSVHCGGGGGGVAVGMTADGPVDPFSDPGFPVEILPHLFLGNAQNSRDCDALDKHSIRYVVNVTPNLPNVFEDSGTIKYLQIPITDHWSQNLASFFPSAISFIDGARERQQGVLVHCLAGISRSVTITVAYLMYKLSMSMNDAYDYVRSKKSNISPNFNFMGQLLDFERQLNPPSPARCTCHLSSSSSSSSSAALEADVVGKRQEVKSDEHSTAISFTRLSIEEADEPDDGVQVDEDEPALPPAVNALGRSDSGLPSSSSMSPCSTASSPALPLVRSSSSGSTGAGSAKRLRTLVCRCQASLAQCHFTTPTPL